MNGHRAARGEGRRRGCSLAGTLPLLIVVAVSAGGCGSSSRTAASPSGISRSAAASTGPAAPPRSLALQAQERALHAQVSAALHHLADRQVRYGSPARYLPRGVAAVDRLQTGTIAHPALAIEGDTVRLQLERASVLASAAGPVIPAAIQGTGAPQTPVSFALTLSNGRGTMPLRAGQFTIGDEFGHIHHPRVSRLGGGPAPSAVPTGRSVTLTLSDRLPVGNGSLRFQPEGVRPTVTWQFSVETD